MATMTSNAVARAFPWWGKAWFRFALVFWIAGAAFAPLASAQSIVFTTMASTTGAYGLTINSNQMHGFTANEWTGEINITVSNYNGVPVSPTQTVPTFCIELAQDVSGNTQYTYQVDTTFSHADQGLFSASGTGGLPLSVSGSTAVHNLATLYYLFYPGGTTGWSNVTAAAFQLDCWKITSNPGNYVISGSSAGSTMYAIGTGTTGATGSAVALAQTWLTAVSNTNVGSSGSSYPVALTNGTAQDLLFTQYIDTHLVPFGVEAWPGAAVLGMIALLRVRHRLNAPG